MNALILYASQFGSTREIAARIGDVLGAQGLHVDVCPVDRAPNPACYDALIVGSAVHGGHWLKPAADFLRRERDLLADRPVWLFSSGPVGDMAVRSAQPDPREVVEFGRATPFREHRVFAGSFDRATADFDELGVIERTVVRRFLPDGDWRDWAAIERWVGTIASQLRQPVPA